MAQPAAAGRSGPDRLPALLVAMTAVTGMVDAVSFLGLGQVFTGNMTGNVALLGFAFAGAEGLTAVGHLISLGAFIAGALVAGLLLSRLVHRSASQRLLGMSGLTSVLIAVAALLAIGLSELHASTAERAPVIALLGLAMGMRAAAAYQLHIPGMPVSVVTSTLTGLLTDVATAGQPVAHPWSRAAAVAAMFAGAVAGGVLVLNAGISWTLLVAAVLGPALAAAYALAPGAASRT
jgi:uncharacterized membrane protein YoaK (UPF0700 family)